MKVSGKSLVLALSIVFILIYVFHLFGRGGIHMGKHLQGVSGMLLEMIGHYGNLITLHMISVISTWILILIGSIVILGLVFSGNGVFSLNSNKAKKF